MRKRPGLLKQSNQAGSLAREKQRDSAMAVVATHEPGNEASIAWLMVSPSAMIRADDFLRGCDSLLRGA
jgi:hypothetical protein